MLGRRWARGGEAAWQAHHTDRQAGQANSRRQAYLSQAGKASDCPWWWWAGRQVSSLAGRQWSEPGPRPALICLLILSLSPSAFGGRRHLPLPSFATHGHYRQGRQLPGSGGRRHLNFSLSDIQEEAVTVGHLRLIPCMGHLLSAETGMGGRQAEWVLPVAGTGVACHSLSTWEALLSLLSHHILSTRPSLP